MVLSVAVRQAAEVSFTSFGLSDGAVDAVVLASVAFFPVVVLLAWRFDLSREGLLRTVGLDELEGTGTGVVPRASEGRETPPPSLAVLPFLDLSPDHDHEYFTDGLAEEILNALAAVPGLAVASRTSSFAFRARSEDVRRVGAEMGVSHVLEGSVRRWGGTVRVTAQLVDTGDGFHLWSRSYERPFEDVLRIQDDITARIVDELLPNLGPVEGGRPVGVGTGDATAYDLYVRGRHLWYNRFRVGLLSAMEYFEKARARDPDFPLPWTGISMTFTTLGYMGFLPHEEARKGLAAARRALELDPDLPEGHLALGMALGYSEWSWAEADSHLARAAELRPGYGEALVHRALLATLTGDPEEGHRLALAARVAEPRSAYVTVQTGHERLWAGEPEGAAEELERALAMEPASLIALILAALAWSESGEEDRAVSAAEKAVELGNRAGFTVAVLSFVLARAGRREEAAALGREMEERAREEFVSPVVLASTAASVGRTDAALERLERAVAERSPVFGGVRDTPGFRAALEEMGLPASPESAAGQPSRYAASFS